VSQPTISALSVDVSTASLDPWPLAADQIVEGSPQASGSILWKSADSRLANGVWECTTGAFTWLHADETLCVVSGRATVTPDGGEPVELSPGVIAFFPEGTRTRWQVHETLRKAFHLHASEPLPF
jgi:uncharacterized cupin superfamily protein